MKTIEIVTHCQSIQRPYYTALLTYQLSSLVLYPPKLCKVVMTVCCCFEDEATWRVLDFFLNKLDLNIIVLSPERLGRRAIGRNMAAKSTRADIVWFTDGDYVFREGCLDSLARVNWPEGYVLIHPNIVKRQHNRRKGKIAIEKVRGNPQVVNIQVDEFIDATQGRATGGIQIVQGDFARKHGYCPTFVTSHTPISDGSFVSTKCDLNFRLMCTRLGKQTGIDIANVYRLSHPKRKYGGKGMKRCKE